MYEIDMTDEDIENLYWISKPKEQEELIKIQYISEVNDNVFDDFRTSS